jgi:hypothetical protein
MLLYLVAMVAVVIGLFVAIVQYHRSANKKQFGSRRQKVQAQMLARGAQQHFLLKMKFMASQIYEAAGFSVGRNPYYDFSAYLTGTDGTQVFPMDPLAVGPLFFTGGPGTTIAAVTPSGDSQAPAAAKVMVVDRSGESLDPGTALGLFSGAAFAPGAVSGASNRHVMSFPLEHFLVDVSTNFPLGSPVVRIDSAATYADRASMGASSGGDVQWRDPFTASYFVEDFRILGLGGGGSRSGKKYEADTVIIATEAQVRIDNQCSVVTGTGGQPRKLDMMARETHASFRAQGAGSGWPELDLESTESDAARSARNPTSARRTELVTSTYLVRRPE